MGLWTQLGIFGLRAKGLSEAGFGEFPKWEKLDTVCYGNAPGFHAGLSGRPGFKELLSVRSVRRLFANFAGDRRQAAEKLSWAGGASYCGLKPSSKKGQSSQR